MQGYLNDAMKSEYDAALYQQFLSYVRPFTLYLDEQTAVINTNPSFAGMFGDSSHNVTGPTSTPVTPQPYLLSGCILYGNKQPWEYIEPGSRGNWHQDKVRESFGIVRIKVDATGQALLSQANQVVLDGFTFNLDSNARPHGLVGPPTRWTFEMKKTD